VPRISDRDRILRMLVNSDGLSNARIRAELSLDDSRYAKTVSALLKEGLVETYRCRSGGLRLTKQGEKAAPKVVEGKSGVAKETELYEHLVSCLTTQAQEDGVDAVVVNCGSLRSRGQCRNPDVAQLTVERYRRLPGQRVTVTTYEVKQFPPLDVGAAYEAASHHGFAHEAWVVLEWAAGVEFSLTDSTYRVDQIVEACQRFGLGLATLDPYYKSYRLRARIDPRPQIPDDQEVDAWLDYLLSRKPDAEKAFTMLLRPASS